MSLTIVLGAYLAFVILPEHRAARQLRGRLRPEGPDAPSLAGLTRTIRPLSAVRRLDAVLSRSGRLIAPLRRTVENSGLAVTIGLVVLASIFAMFVGFTVMQAITHVLTLAIAVSFLAASVPYLWVRHAAQRRLRQFEEQFPQSMDLIASALRAGHAFTTAISMVADEVQDPTGAEFRLMYDRQNFGMPLPDALKAFAQRVPLLDARFFITAVLTQREAGGNLAEVLDNLAALIRERSRIKRQVRVASAHGRATGWVLSLMPPVLASVMVFIAPAHMRIFVEDPLGMR
ncbi:MAG TPA: type II secretion system F family protein, partial [Sphingomicrobium sp.]